MRLISWIHPRGSQTVMIILIIWNVSISPRNVLMLLKYVVNNFFNFGPLDIQIQCSVFSTLGSIQRIYRERRLGSGRPKMGPWRLGQFSWIFGLLIQDLSLNWRDSQIAMATAIFQKCSSFGKLDSCGKFVAVNSHEVDAMGWKA
jgi:hypothetical protein